MTAENGVCKLCFETVEENDKGVIEEDLKEMLQTVVKIDFTISENLVICNKCHDNLVENYNFRRKCIFMEDSITPFVSDNVKFNLKEVRNQIIKSEDIEDDKNVCRLCLKFVDNDMLLSDGEKEQFRQFLPEIDLLRTNFVILCSTCYDLLQKYFIFVTYCLGLEQRLNDYSLGQMGDKIDITEEQIDNKVENFQTYIKKEEDKKEAISREELGLNEEIDIKCDIEEDDSSFYEDVSKDSWNIDSTYKVHLRSVCDSPTAINCKCGKYRFANKCVEELVRQVRSDHSYNKMYECRNVTHKTKQKFNFIRHIQKKHSNNSKTKIYNCENCTYETNYKHDLVQHVQYEHSDSLKIALYQCENCTFETKYRTSLIQHIQHKHSDPSKIIKYKCENCTYRTKWKKNLVVHVRHKHSDPSKIKIYKCENCTYRTKWKRNLAGHFLNRHADPSKIKIYKCENCTYETKYKPCLVNHVEYKHSDPSKIKMYKCEKCTFETKYKRSLIRHAQSKHADPSTIKIYD